MPWTAIAWSVAWVASGVAVAAAVRALGYHPRNWGVLGVLVGPLVLPLWAARRIRPHPGPELVEVGWPPQGALDLLVVPRRGPTPELVRAIAELRGARRRVAIARILPFDSPKRAIAESRLHLIADRGALGLPGAELLLLFGPPGAAIELYARHAGVGLVLIDGDLADRRGSDVSVRVLRPEDVPPAERRDSVRILTSVRPVARVVRLPVDEDGSAS